MLNHRGTRAILLENAASTSPDFDLASLLFSSFVSFLKFSSAAFSGVYPFPIAFILFPYIDEKRH